MGVGGVTDMASVCRRGWQDDLVQAVRPGPRLAGWRPMARDSGTEPGKAKGKGKDGGRAEGKGGLKRDGTNGRHIKGRGKSTGKGSGGIGGKGPGRYQEACWLGGGGGGGKKGVPIWPHICELLREPG